MNEEYIENSDVESVDLPSSELSESDITSKISSLLNDDLTVKQPSIEPVQESIPELPTPEIPSDYKVKVKVNGTEQEVSLEELKNGYQRQSDYTSKTQELAQQRNEVNAQKQQYDQYVNSIPMLALVAQQNMQAAQEQLYGQELLDLAQSDPAEYIARKAAIEKTLVENQRAYAQMQNQYQEYQTQQAQTQNQNINNLVQQANEILERELGDSWKDGSLKQTLREYALQNNFSDNDLNNLYDYRQVTILNKARLYDEMVSKQNLASKKVQNVPRVIKSESTDSYSDVDDFAKQRAAALKSGDDRAIAALIARMI